MTGTETGYETEGPDPAASRLAEVLGMAPREAGEAQDGTGASLPVSGDPGSLSVDPGAAQEGPRLYRGLPAPVEAWQVTAASAPLIADWCGGAWEDGMLPDCPGNVRVHVPTRVGALTAPEGFWVTRDYTGQRWPFWPVPADLFATFYGPAAEPCGDKDAPDAGGTGQLTPVIEALRNLDDGQVEALGRIAALWAANPELRLGQLIGNVYSFDDVSDPYYLADDAFVAGIEGGYGIYQEGTV